MATSHSRLRPRSETVRRAETLLGRYPHLSEHELAELINLLPHLSLLDQGLMTGDDHLRPRFADFHRDHGRKLKGSRGALVALLAFPVMLAVLAFWQAIG